MGPSPLLPVVPTSLPICLFDRHETTSGSASRSRGISDLRTREKCTASAWH
jgi:hypothetical protein